MIELVSELKDYVATLKNVPEDYKLAVGSLIFDDDDRVILIERGEQSRASAGKWEGVGGGLEAGETNLIDALQREIREEIGDVEVEVLDCLTVLTLPGSKEGFWVVPVYLCRLRSGIPKVMEPNKIGSIQYVKLENIDPSKLSSYQQVTMNAYQQKFGNNVFDFEEEGQV